MSGQKTVRVFESDFMESLTHVHPIIPLLLWSPVSLYLFYLGATVDGHGMNSMISIFVLGILFWTFTEYTLHRFVFHFPAKGRIGKRFVFLFHGLHHDAPNEATRLVMPPVPAILIMSLLYSLFSLVVPKAYLNTFMASFIVGYLCYDYIHYATHHFPMKTKIGQYLRKFHLQHHYKCPDAKYGVSNPLWDYIFNTIESKKK